MEESGKNNTCRAQRVLAGNHETIAKILRITTNGLKGNA
jgi:hypothetical protein